MVIQVPLEFQDKLEPRENVEKRTDDEILRTLLEFQPVTSEKNIWTFWDKGIHAMPAWCRRNVISWVRICGPEWTIRVLDSVPGSPTHGAKYVPEGLPDTYYNNTMNGTHPGPHSADFLRGACLYQYGGAWMDSSIFLIRTMDDLCWNRLEDTTSPFRVAVPVMSGVLLNCFLAARRHDPFIKRWQEVFMETWKGQTNSDGLAQHPLIKPVVPSFLENLDEHVNGMGLNVQIDKVIEYALQMACWSRVTMLEDAGDGFSGADYWPNNVLWINCMQEVVRAFHVEGSEIPAYWKGQEIFDYFSTRRDGPTDSAKYKEAEKFVWDVLTKSSMLKIGTVQGMVDWVSLSTLWNKPENLGKDCEPGTFAELLREVPQHFRQKRKDIVTYPTKRSPVTFKKGALEP
ncbi:hypothetical protein F5Y12DRAFT_776767 [Xylaria sp. FL1777]|nr:hypothetical protein F5Y12DRAFT_776767 [Xylaria sp. FL1777]